MRNCSNPVETLLELPWDTYRNAAFRSQVASGVLVTITALVVVTLAALHPGGGWGFIAANYEVSITLATVGGAAFVIFVISSAVHYCGIKKMKQDFENERRLAEIQSRYQSSEQDTEVGKSAVSKASEKSESELEIVAIKEDPVEHVKEVLLKPILKELNRAVRSLVVADCVKMSRSIGDKDRQVDNAFEDGEDLFLKLVDNPHLYAGELLRYFGRGKKPPSVALRRTIAAYNSGDKKKYAEVKEEYLAITRGYDMRDIATALKTKSNEELLHEFPDLIENHFSLPDAPLQKLGKKILDHIFKATSKNQEVLSALQELKNTASKSDEIVRDVEKFIQSVYEEANIPKSQLEEWNKELVTYMLDVQFKKTICRILGALARNIRILKLMFNQDMDQKPLFIALDETFLLSESSDCVKKEALQKDILRLQSTFNYERNERERIAFIALPQEDTRPYELLMEENEVVKLCCQANPQDLSVLLKISNDKAVQQLASQYSVRLVAVPVSISDHPFKAFKKYEGIIRVAAWGLKRFLPGMIKPKILEMLPKMEENDLERFESLFDTLLNVLIDPIYDGSIGRTKFRSTFERIITEQGEQLAARLEELILDEELSFEKIRDVWTHAVRAVAVEFEQVRR